MAFNICFSKSIPTACIYHVYTTISVAIYYVHTDQNLWLGMYRRPGGGVDPLADFWYDGEDVELIYENFHAGEPDDAPQPDSNCVAVFHLHAFEWFDVDFTLNVHSVCEV